MHDPVRAITLWGYDDLVTDLGGDAAALRARYGLLPGIEHHEESFVSLDAFMGLVATTATELDCADFGLRLSEHQGLPILGPVAVIARHSATVREGIMAIARFMPAHSPALHLGAGDPEPDGEVRLRYDATRSTLPDLRQPFELAMANAARIVRLLSGGAAGPAAIWLPHAPISPVATYEQALGCPVVFEADWCGLAVTDEVLALEIDTADPHARRMATAYLESNYPDAGVPLAQRVGELVRRLLPTGHYSVDVVADHLHLHRRTLQRRLVEEGASYAGVLDEQRRDLAVRYLGQPDLQVGQIAILLGYTEQSAFNRAFNRWFGVSPRQYRASHR